MLESSQYPDSSVAQLGVRTSVTVLRESGGELLLGEGHRYSRFWQDDDTNGA